MYGPTADAVSPVRKRCFDGSAKNTCPQATFLGMDCECNCNCDDLVMCPEVVEQVFDAHGLMKRRPWRMTYKRLAVAPGSHAMRNRSSRVYSASYMPHSCRAVCTHAARCTVHRGSVATCQPSSTISCIQILRSFATSNFGPATRSPHPYAV